jgi:hypothetical protein
VNAGTADRGQGSKEKRMEGEVTVLFIKVQKTNAWEYGAQAVCKHTIIVNVAD